MNEQTQIKKRRDHHAPVVTMTEYRDEEVTREEVDRMQGPVLLDFGASWCPHCQALEPYVDRLLAEHPQVQHIKIADGRGKPLGRSFRVKLWPNLVFMKDGAVLTQLARPEPEAVREAFLAFTGK